MAASADLSTTYLGLQLPQPFMVGASPLVDHLDTVTRLASSRHSVTSHKNWSAALSRHDLHGHLMRQVSTQCLALALVASGQTVADPFAFFRPSVVVAADDRRQLDRGEPVARILPGKDHQIAIFAAIPVNIDSDRLVAWTRQIAEFKKSTYVQAIRRFSDPPAIHDLAALSLDDKDLAEIRECQPADCALKLTEAEMHELQRAADEGGPAWKPALQDAFRRLVLHRVEAYLQGGHAALGRYEDEKGRESLEARFSLIMQQSEFLTRALPLFAEYLQRYPQADMPGVESFVYWSKEGVGGKRIISATHVSIVRHDDRTLPDVIVAGKEIFATHYVNASLGLTAIMRGSNGQNYLVYLNRSEVDVLGGFFGGLVRMTMGRRLKAEASGVLRGLRNRLESGEPFTPPRVSTEYGSIGVHLRWKGWKHRSHTIAAQPPVPKSRRRHAARGAPSGGVPSGQRRLDGRQVHRRSSRDRRP